jgi:hypothetical protein
MSCVLAQRNRSPAAGYRSDSAARLARQAASPLSATNFRPTTGNDHPVWIGKLQ